MISKALFDTSRINMNKKCIKLGKQISAAIAVNYIFLKIQWTHCRCSYYSFCVHFSKLPEHKPNNLTILLSTEQFNLSSGNLKIILTSYKLRSYKWIPSWMKMLRKASMLASKKSTLMQFYSRKACVDEQDAKELTSYVNSEMEMVLHSEGLSEEIFLTIAWSDAVNLIHFHF